MARTDARSISIDDTEKDKLAEIYGEVIEAVQKEAVSEQIKNKNYSGDATAGSVEFSRFANAKIEDLGTARKGGKGNALKNSGKVTVNIDNDKEIVEEVANKDIRLHGVAGMAERRKEGHIKQMSAYLDREFFTKAEAEGTKVTLDASLTTIQDKLEGLIQSVETTKNDWVDGVDRDMLVLTLTPAEFGKLANYIDSVPNSITGLKEEYFHGVKVYRNNRQTKSAICMIEGAVAQPVVADVYETERIPLSNDTAIELFFSNGTKAIMPDLIKYLD